MMFFIQWTGAICMMIAPFMIDTASGKMLAVVGLSLLTVQAYRLKAFNLILINLISIGGFIWSILK